MLHVRGRLYVCMCVRVCVRVRVCVLWLFAVSEVTTREVEVGTGNASSMLKTPSITVTVENLRQYLSEIVREGPVLPEVQVSAGPENAAVRFAVCQSVVR
jgi:hypothetical protein